MSRVDPLAIDDIKDDLSDFSPRAPTALAKPVVPEVIDEISRKAGFPSRQPTSDRSPISAPAQKQQRRYVTGRNQQINIKAKAETIALLNQIADQLSVPLGEVLERALLALDVSLKLNQDR